MTDMYNFTISNTNYLCVIHVHRRRKVSNIGGQRFRILGGQEGANSQQAYDVVTTSCAHKVFNKSVPNNYISHLKF